MITREESMALVQEHIKDRQLIYHSIMTEAVLQELAAKLDQDQDLWARIGLSHDLDYTATKDLPENHGLRSCDMLEDKLPDEGLQAIRAHNGELNGNTPQTSLDFALRCGESITGLVYANALVRPQGMEGMKAKSLKKKMKDKSFAASVRRENIQECEKIGLELSEFLTLSIKAIQSIAPQVGLD